MGSVTNFTSFAEGLPLTLRTSYVTDAQLREIRKVIRSAWSTEKKKPLTKGNKQLLDIIQRQGDVPNDKGQGEYKTFYEPVRQQFNAK